jgi:HJR/Mrr/RecB family endonuclease
MPRKPKGIRISLRTFAAIIGLMLLVVLLPAIADTIASSRNPTLARIGFWMIVAAVLVLAGVAYHFVRTRRKTKERELKDLLALTSSGFELAIASLLHDLGYKHIEHVGRPNDLAADIRARGPQGHQIVVQCKRLVPGTRVGSPEIQKFIGMAKIHHGADHGIFVTTAEFTGPAIELARQHGIALWDGEYLAAALARIHKPVRQTAA